MNKLITISFVFLLAQGCSNSEKNESSPVVVSDSEVLDELFSLSDNQNFFELKSSFETNKNKLAEDYLLYFKSIIENSFNNPSESNLAITSLLELSTNTLDDTLMQSLYQLKILNHTNLYEYNLANQTTDLLLKNSIEALDSAVIVDLNNTNKIWAALKDVPKQRVIRNRDFTIPLVRDIAGLFNVDATFSDTTKNLIFDTGANFSVIRRSMVEKLGLVLIKSDFLVRSATGTQVKSDLAIADKMDIGGITIKNVVFLVFEDEALTFPGYEINGIIGYPVIEALKEIHITKDNQLFIPKDLTHYNQNNFALDGFMPVVYVKKGKDNLLFHFDTGAGKTSLFSNYYKKYKEGIESKYQKESFSSASAGGIVEFEGYIIPELKLSIAGSGARLDSLQLHIEDIGEKENNFHGNLGQDFIKQFDKMVISFEYSSILFE